MRKTARENAFKLIFERLINGSENKLSYAAITAAMNDDDKQFLDALLNGVLSEYDFLSEVIGGYASGYAIDRIYKIDLAILLISSYEILFMEDVPVKVSANEAVELAKTYSTDNSPAFINGIIASVIKNKESIINERNSD